MTNAVYDPSEFGKRLKKLRQTHGMTQEALAEKLVVSVDSISKYENGRVAIGHDSIIRLCCLFNVSADYFYFGIQQIKPETEGPAGELMHLITSIDEKEKKRALEILKLVFVNQAG